MEKRMCMVQLKLEDGEIEILSDAKIEKEEDLFMELNRILCFSIAIYKRQIEKMRKKELANIDETIINQKIKDSIVMIPVDEVRDLIKESDI